MSNNVPLDSLKPLDLPPPEALPGAGPTGGDNGGPHGAPRGPTSRGGEGSAISQLGRAPAPPDGGSPGVSLASRRSGPPWLPEAPTPPAPAPTPTSHYELNSKNQEELTKTQKDTDALEDEQTRQQIRTNTATAARTLALKASERMGVNFKNGADIQSKLI
ncbi:hypothetical protein OU995_18590 [Roseateles sp. SL47]|uniref:hypothetical protein n=1 Tax=Roseateles sp. SL47 TaxID=2995138 RepID=UPI00226E3AAC|nr:hypothetical protein [Roseateles sp. SL47]WAC71580.1 hypothetical protein OU995_18590 [Roseateles sp. SL47]